MNKFITIFFFLLTFFPLRAEGLELTVYTDLEDERVKPVFNAYQEETGTEIIHINGSEDSFLQRLKAEGPQTPADILITVDAGNLWDAADEGLLDPIDSQVLFKNIPEHLRDPSDRWFGFSVYAPVLVHHWERADPYELWSYSSLATSQWQGRLCLETSEKAHTQSLVAMMIEEKGMEETEAIVRGWVANLAVPPFSNDAAVMEAIAAGKCDAGIVNTDSYVRLMQANPELPLALFWPNQDDSGVYVNISGAGIVKYSDDKEESIKFLEWLSSEKGQRLFADIKREYPVNPAVKPHPEVADRGDFRQNIMNVSRAGALRKEALMLMDRAGYR